MIKHSKVLFALALQIMLLRPAQAQVPMRILYPNEVSGAGQGWSVDPHAGALTMSFPVATVPGDIPIPVAYRINASHVAELRPWVTYVYHNDGTVTTRNGTVPQDRPVFGSTHFGFIVPAVRNSNYTDPIFYTLEDGTRYRDDDFTAALATFNLAPLFGFAAKDPTLVRVNPAGTLAVYDATSADLGSWATTASQVSPAGYGTLSASYKVVMDRDRARVFQYVSILSTWVPILWVDRFGHSVSYQWQQFTTNLPSSVQAIHSVKVLNQRGKGLQLQWAVYATGTSGILDLVRMDFIGIQAPSVQIKGYNGAPYARPAGMTDVTTSYFPTSPRIAGPISRPQEIKMANPANLVAPSWLYAGLPVPAATSGNTWAGDLAWTFSYDANQAEFTGFTDPLQVSTSFSYQSNSLTPSTSYWNKLRGVTSASAVDGQTGTTLGRSYTYSIPTGATGTWVTSATQGFSPATAGGALKTEYTFAGPGDPNYGNGVLTQQRLFDSLGTQWWIQTQGYTQAGLNQTLSVANSVASTPLGGPTRNTAITPDATTGAPKGSSLQVGTTYKESATFTYEAHLDVLDPVRLISVGRSRTVGTVTSTAPAQKTVYNAAMQPSQVYADGGTTGQMGQNLSYYSSVDGLLNGHLKTSSNYGAIAGGVTSGVATQTANLDPATSLPSSMTVTYDAPAGGTNSTSRSVSNYDSADRPQTVVDARGVSTTLTYDTRGRVLTRTPSGQGTTTYAYPTERTRTITWNGTTVTETTDGFGRLLSRSRPDGITENYQYDASGRRTYTQELNRVGTSRSTTTSYDPLGRVTGTNPPLGTSVVYTYAAVGDDQRVTASYTGTGVAFSSQQFMDPWGQAVKTVDPNGTVTTATYDAQGHLLTSIANGIQTRSFGYNALGLLISRTEPETQTTTFSTFNVLGLPTSITEAGARTRALVYDGLGRLRSAVNGADNQGFIFNGPFLASASTTSGGQSASVTYGYVSTGPGLGQLQSETATLPGGAPSWITSYGYDSLGRLNTQTAPSGRSTTYGFDGLSRINLVSQIPGGTTTAIKVADVDYDDWGYRKDLFFASGATSSWTTGTYGLQLESWSVTPLGGAAITRSYGYDGKHDLNRADLTTGGEWGTLVHDNLGRLTSATGFGLSNTLTHDAYSNNTASTSTGSVPSSFNAFTFNPLADNRLPGLTSAGSLTGWSINARGEATSAGTAVGAVPALGFTWDGLGRLNAATVSGVSQTYGYLPSGMRFQLTDSADASKNRRYAYTSGGLLLGEYTGSGATWNWKRDVIYLGGEAIAEIDGAGIHELHKDHLGSPRVITNSGGVIEGTQAYGPYGEAFPAPYASGYVPLTGYTGHVQTDTTGLIYMRGRFYSPIWHRFINSDQGVDPNSWNQMAYVGGGPFHGIDPSGMAINVVDGNGKVFKTFETWDDFMRWASSAGGGWTFTWGADAPGGSGAMVGVTAASSSIGFASLGMGSDVIGAGSGRGGSGGTGASGQKGDPDIYEPNCYDGFVGSLEGTGRAFLGALNPSNYNSEAMSRLYELGPLGQAERHGDAAYYATAGSLVVAGAAAAGAGGIGFAEFTGMTGGGASGTTGSIGRIPVEDLLSGGWRSTGWRFDAKPHNFLGKPLPHWQINFFKAGVKGSGATLRIPCAR